MSPAQAGDLLKRDVGEWGAGSETRRQATRSVAWRNTYSERSWNSP
jgi:hypothetical protein